MKITIAIFEIFSMKRIPARLYLRNYASVNGKINRKFIDKLKNKRHFKILIILMLSSKIF